MGAAASATTMVLEVKELMLFRHALPTIAQGLREIVDENYFRARQII
jgi:hypothetical protein